MVSADFAPVIDKETDREEIRYPDAVARGPNIERNRRRPDPLVMYWIEKSLKMYDIAHLNEQLHSSSLQEMLIRYPKKSTQEQQQTRY